MSTSQSYFDVVKRQIQNQPAMESWIGFKNVLDVTIRAFHNISTSLIKGFETVKRSELKAYHQSHLLILKQFFQERSFRVMAIRVDIPHQMNVSYPQAIKYLEDAVKALELDKTVESLKKFLSALPPEIGKIDNDKLVQETKKLAISINKATPEKIDELHKLIFSDSQDQEKIPFRDAFQSFDALKECDEKILAYEDWFKAFPKITKAIHDLEDHINRIIDSVEHGTHVDKDFVEAFHSLVYNAAVQFDALGVYFHIAQMLEHNFVLSLDKLVKTYIESKK